MVLFGFIFVVGVLAIFGVQTLDIECERERTLRPRRIARVETRSGFPAEPMALRQI